MWDFSYLELCEPPGMFSAKYELVERETFRKFKQLPWNDPLLTFIFCPSFVTLDFVI